MTITIVLWAGLTLPLAVSAHEHGKNAAGEAGQGAAATVHALTIVEHENGTMAFSPDTVRVKRGETVRFDVTNSGKLPHEFRVDSIAGNAAPRGDDAGDAGH